MDENLILKALTRIENKQDSQGVDIAKIQGWISSNGFVREKTCHALHAATKDDLAEFKAEIRNSIKTISGRQWIMWGKISAIVAAMTAAGFGIQHVIGG